LNISNLRYNLTITNTEVRGGCREFTHEEFRNLTMYQCDDKGWSEKELETYKSFLTSWENMQTNE
jgi:hypothetical protein